METKILSFMVEVGGQNTSYFHRAASAHRRYNSIDQFQVEGVLIRDSKILKEEIVSFYPKLYTET